MDKMDKTRSKTACLVVLLAYAYTIYNVVICLLNISAPWWLLRGFGAFVIVISCLLYFSSCYESRFCISKAEWHLLLLIIYILVNYFITDVINGANETAADTIEDFFARSIPAVLIGFYAAKKFHIDLLSRATNLLLFLLVLCSTKILLFSVAFGYSAFMWDATFSYNYQNVSYMAATAVGIALYKLFVERKQEKVIQTVYYIYSVLICFALSVYSGGRGGVVLCLVYVVALCAYYAFIEKKATKLLSIAIFVIVCAVFFMNYAIENSIFATGFLRAFEFIDKSGGINWEGTSGRLSIYQKSLELITEKPIFGYGITGSPRIGVERSHNIFLDILLDGGILYLIVWAFIFYRFAKNCLNKMKFQREYALLVVFFLSDFILLCFSGVYMRTSVLWFSIAYSFCNAVYSSKEVS